MGLSGVRGQGLRSLWRGGPWLGVGVWGLGGQTLGVWGFGLTFSWFSGFWICGILKWTEIPSSQGSAHVSCGRTWVLDFGLMYNMGKLPSTKRVQQTCLAPCATFAFPDFFVLSTPGISPFMWPLSRV